MKSSGFNISKSICGQISNFVAAKAMNSGSKTSGKFWNSSLNLKTQSPSKRSSRATHGPFDRKWVFRVKMEKYDLLTNYFEVMFLLSLYDVFTQQA